MNQKKKQGKKKRENIGAAQQPEIRYPEQQLAEQAAAVLREIAVSRRIDVPWLRQQLEPAFAAAGFRAPAAEALTSILVIRLDRIGDFILMSPFLRELRRSYPAAWITLVVSPVVESLAERCPYVNEVIVLPLADRMLTVHGLEQALAFARERLWSRHFDQAFCPRETQSICVDGSVAYLSGARERFGFSANTYGAAGEQARAMETADALFTQVRQLPHLPLQELEHNLQLLELAGIRVQDRRLEVWYDAADAAQAAELCAGFAPGRRLAAVSLGASEPRKTYPAEQLAEALTELAADGVSFLLLGGPGDREAGEALAASLPDGTARNLAGASSLRVSEALIARTELYIGNDTGLLHMAAALHRPIVELSCDLEGPAELAFLHLPVRFQPWQVPYILLRPAQGLGPCAGLGSPLGCMAPTAHCIAQIPAAAVAAAARQLLALGYSYR